MHTKLKFNKYFMTFPKMADQTPKIKSKRQVLEFKPSRLCLQTLVVGLCVFYARICLVLSATCPPSVPISAATTTEQCTFDFYFADFKYDFYLGQSCVASQNILLLKRMELLWAQCPIVSTTCTGYNQKRRSVI